MTKQNNLHLNWIKLLGITSLVIGSLLLILMVCFEDEPGAIPLLLIIIGITTLIINRFKRKHT